MHMYYAIFGDDVDASLAGTEGSNGPLTSTSSRKFPKPRKVCGGIESLPSLLQRRCVRLVVQRRI